jgi:hypothetical protein
LAASALSLLPVVAGLLLLVGAAAIPASRVLQNVGVFDRLRRRTMRFFETRLGGLDRLVLLRFLVTGCQALTVLITWPVWQTRRYPPLLPMAGIPQLDFGPLVLASLVLVLVVPRVGIWVHVGTMALAFVADQTRLQPELVSLALLLVATNLPRWGPFVGRAHLITMWIWAGTHKVLSVGFMTDSAYWIYDGLPVKIPAIRAFAGWLIAGSEAGTGLLMLIRPLRRAGVTLALILHGMILLVLSPWGQDWNESVWPWNFALGIAAFVLFWPWQDEVKETEAPVRREARVKIAVAAVAALYPLGFYFGLTDAYLAHHLYSDAIARAYCEPENCRSAAFGDTWEAFDLFIPPEPRLYKEYFLSQCKPGERLTILPRQTKILIGRNSTITTLKCP